MAEKEILKDEVGKMKRIVAFAVMLIFVLPCLAVSAEGSSFYCEYAAKTETGSIFYVDIVAVEETSAAVFELSFDENMVEFRSASAMDESCNVRSRCEGGKLSLVFVSSYGSKGKICRTAFKTVNTGDCTFSLHTSQAADAELEYITALSDSSLGLRLGKDSVTVTSTTKGGTTDNGNSGNSSADGSYTELSSYTDNGDGQSFGANILDLRTDKSWVYILLGAGGVILIVLLFGFGIYIGRKSNKKRTETATKAEQGSTENKAESALGNVNENTDKNVTESAYKNVDNGVNDMAEEQENEKAETKVDNGEND